MKYNLRSKVLVVAMVSWLLSGCGAMVVGGAGAGGYYVGQDERTVGEISSDAAITSKVNAEYVKDKQVSALDIDVDTFRGVVTLHGHVDSKAAAIRAVTLASSVKGVKNVISRLKVLN